MEWRAYWIGLQLLLCCACLPRAASAQPVKAEDPRLLRAEQLIDRGRHQQASDLLSTFSKNNAATVTALQACILQARILHENGQRMQAIALLRTLLQDPHLQAPSQARVKTEAHLLLAECYLFLNWMERFKALNDTIRQTIATHRLDNALLCRSYTNYLRYYNFLVLGPRALPYLDSAMSLLRQAPAREKPHYQPLSLATAYVNFTRNYGSIKAKVRDSLLQARNDLRNHPVYLQVHWWRTLGNMLFDYARIPDDRANNRRWYPSAAGSFQRASQLLSRYYPNNLVDQVTLSNLRGLQDFYCGYFASSQQHFATAETMLRKSGIDTLDIAPLYNHTLTYQNNTLDSLYQGQHLLQAKKRLLRQWEAFAPVWEQWEALEQNKEVRTYRSAFSAGPYDLIVRLCYDLYSMEGNHNYVNRAFLAQEAGKARLFKSSWQKHRGTSPPPVPPVSALQKNLSPEQAMLSLSFTRSSLDPWFFILIGRDTVVFKRLSGDSILGIPVPQFGEPDSLCRSPRQFTRIFHHLYQHFFDSLAKVLPAGVKELEIYHSSFDARFNMGLLLSDSTWQGSYVALPYLFRKYRLVHQYSWQSSRMTASASRHRTGGPINAQAYIPDYTHTPLNRLPFFEKSGHRLSGQYGFQTYMKGKATLPQFMARAGMATILHLAGHLQGAMIGYAGEMEILLDQQAGSANTIHTQVIDELRLQADLVVLSLCESGQGDAIAHEGYVSMPYWFMVAGARSCLYSIWKLDEKAGSFIIERFYHYLARGLRKSDALVQAQEDYLAQCRTEEERNPKYWAGLMLIGDDSPLILEKRMNRWHLLWLLLIPLGVWFYQRQKRRPKRQLTNG